MCTEAHPSPSAAASTSARTSSRTAANTNANAPARARTHSLLVHRNDVAAHATLHAPLPLPSPSPHHSTHTTPFSLCRTSHAAPTARGGGLAARAQRLFLVQEPHPFFGRPFALATCSALCRARIQARTHARAWTIATRSALHHVCTRTLTYARARATDDTTRRAVRQRG